MSTGSSRVPPLVAGARALNPADTAARPEPCRHRPGPRLEADWGHLKKTMMNARSELAGERYPGRGVPPSFRVDPAAPRLSPVLEPPQKCAPVGPAVAVAVIDMDDFVSGLARVDLGKTVANDRSEDHDGDGADRLVVADDDSSSWRSEASFASSAGLHEFDGAVDTEPPAPTVADSDAVESVNHLSTMLAASSPGARARTTWGRTENRAGPGRSLPAVDRPGRLGAQLPSPDRRGNEFDRLVLRVAAYGRRRKSVEKLSRVWNISEKDAAKLIVDFECRQGDRIEEPPAPSRACRDLRSTQSERSPRRGLMRNLLRRSRKRASAHGGCCPADERN